MKFATLLKTLLFIPFLWIPSTYAEESDDSYGSDEIPGSIKGDNYRLSDSECMKGIGSYVVNFTAYNPNVVWERDRGEFKKGSYRKLCQEIPAIGKTYISMDLNDELLEKSVQIRVINTSNKEVLFEGPAQSFPDGTVNAEVDFPLAGRYKAILDIAEGSDGEIKSIRIPLTVGPTEDSFILDVVVPLLLIGGLGFWMYRRDQKKKAAERF